MEIFHLNSYQLTLEEEGVLEIENLKIYIFTNEIQSVDKSSIPEKFVGIFDKYESYRNKNRNETAQFWFAYVEMVQLYHQFTRSIRIGDLDLYIHSLHNISSLFFTFNHHNYAQWLVVCHNNFLNMQKTHPQVYEDFRKGCFAIKRTSKQFPCVSVDLTLEQAFNADAACQRAGKHEISSLKTVSEIQADFLDPSKDKRLRVLPPKLVDLKLQAHQIKSL